MTLHDDKKKEYLRNNPYARTVRRPAAGAPHPRLVMIDALRKIELSINHIPQLIAQLNLDDEQKTTCETWHDRLHSAYTVLIVKEDLSNASIALQHFRICVNKASEKAQSLFEKNNSPGFFERYLQPIMNSIIRLTNTLIGLFTPNKQYQFTYFKTNAETLQSTWDDILDKLGVAEDALIQKNAFRL